MNFLIFSLVLLGGWVLSVSQGSPTPTTVVIKSTAPDGSVRTEKPRCLLSLFGLDPDTPKIPDFDSSPSPYQSTGLGGFGPGLQGGVLSNNNNGFGLGGANIGGSYSGLGLPSQYTPGLGQATDAYKHAQGLQSGLYGSQAQINSQLAGISGSGIPLSPGYLRENNNVFGLRSLPAPPTLFYT